MNFKIVLFVLLLTSSAALKLSEKHISSEKVQVDHAWERTGFLDLHVLLIPSDHSERTEEYCITLQRNSENSLVHSIQVHSPLAEDAAMLVLRDTCKLTPSMLAKVDVISGLPIDELTYKILFQSARSSSAATKLQVIMNSDIILGDGWSNVPSCLNKVHEDGMVFHLARMEPIKCFPLLDGQPRERTSSLAVDKNTYKNICMEPTLAPVSHDAIAFSGNVSDVVLDGFNFAPNHLGAENRVSCALEKAGFMMQNPCEQLQILHNHCSDFRSYSPKRIDGKKGKKCNGHAVPKPKFSGNTKTENICSVVDMH